MPNLYGPTPNWPDMRVLVTGGSGFIGTNLIEALCQHGVAHIVNIDISAPKIAQHENYWEKVDILDSAKLAAVAETFAPTHLVHLAAKADTDSEDIDDYRANIEGSENLLRSAANIQTIERSVIISSQLVFDTTGTPASNTDFRPATAYGISKVETEKLTRAINPNDCWSILRPTNIWGAWHPRYPGQFWRVLQKGMYFHPGKEEVIRSYGYIGTLVAQIMSLLVLPKEDVSKRVFYGGDEPMPLLNWVNGFSVALTGHPVKIVPRFVVRAIALVGDVAFKIGIPCPLTSSRYRSMITDNPVQMSDSIKVLQTEPLDLDQAISDTVRWLRATHPDFQLPTDKA